jgi:hypothetical protein
MATGQTKLQIRKYTHTFNEEMKTAAVHIISPV